MNGNGTENSLLTSYLTVEEAILKKDLTGEDYERLSPAVFQAIYNIDFELTGSTDNRGEDDYISIWYLLIDKKPREFWLSDKKNKLKIDPEGFPRRIDLAYPRRGEAEMCWTVFCKKLDAYKCEYDLKYNIFPVEG